MRWIRKFFVWLAVWTGALLFFLFTMSALGGNLESAMQGLPMWAARALSLAAFPAGVTVSASVLPDDNLAWKRIVVAALLGASLVAMVFVLVNYVGPGFRAEPVGLEVTDTNHLTFGEMRDRMLTAVQDARRNPVGTTDHWFTANALVWQYDARAVASILPMLFLWIGILAGFWIRLTPRSELRQLQYWALGLVLVMSTYLAGENSFELIVAQAAGPVFFSGLFVLFIPVMLTAGLAWPAALLLWHRHYRATGG